jgi:hypothetical protein
MKDSLPTGKSQRGTRNKFNAAHLRALACVIATAGLLTACGGSGSGSIDDGLIASAEAAQKATDGRYESDLGGDGTLDSGRIGNGSSGGSTTVSPNGQLSQAPSTPSAPSAPSAPAKPAAPATINTVDTIVNDMKLMNDTALAGIPSNYGWAQGPGYLMMGNTPRGTNTPSWWNVDNQRYKSSEWWNAILPWIVIFDGVGNQASNTRVQVRDMKIYMKSKKSGSWKLLSHSVGVSGENYPKSLQGDNVTTPDSRGESDGSTSIRPPGGSLVFHGWGSFSDIDGSDVAAIFMTLQARLVKDNANGKDDRSSAKYLIHVGGDYYPDRSTRVSDLGPAYYFPGIGTSRAKLVSSEWQAFNFATIDVAKQDPGGALTESEFLASPPPLQ